MKRFRRSALKIILVLTAIIFIVQGNKLDIFNYFRKTSEQKIEKSNFPIFLFNTSKKRQQQ